VREVHERERQHPGPATPVLSCPLDGIWAHRQADGSRWLEGE
jgi:hypothetical protein